MEEMGIFEVMLTAKIQSYSYKISVAELLNV